MSLRARTVLSLGVMFVALFVGLSFALRIIVLRGFKEYEDVDTRRGVHRILSALDDDLRNLSGVARDWAGWDDTYAFIRDRNPAYRKSNLIVDTTPINNRLNLMVYVDTAGRVVFSRAYDFNEKYPLPVPQDLGEHLVPGRLLLDGRPIDSALSGLLRLSGRPLLVAVEPILTSERKGPARGTLIFGRYLDAVAVENLARTTLAAVQIHEPDDSQLPSELRATLLQGPPRSVAIRRLSAERIAGYALLHDVYGQPAIAVEAQRPREIFARARITVLEAVGALLVVGLVFGTFVVLVLERGVLSRIAAMSADIDRIRDRGDFTARVAGRGPADELSRLGDGINEMLQGVEQSRVEREATQAAYRDLEARFHQAHTRDAIGRLAEGIARDFDSLLTIVIGRLSFLLQHVTPGDGVYRHLELIRRIAERASALVEQVLGFSRRQPFDQASVDLNSVVARAEPEFARILGSAVTLRMVLEPSLAPVRGDALQFEQVIMNLVSNARDAMLEGGTLTFETANVELGESFVASHPGVRPGPHVMLRVADTGVGMGPEVRAHLFEPFFTTKGLGRGVGLGLATVYGLVKRAGGYVAVDSAPGQGATFTLYLPRADQETPRSASVAAPGPAIPAVVLVMEPDAEVRNLVRLTLGAGDHRVLEAEDAAEALEIGERFMGSIELLISAASAPVISGRELSFHLGATHPETKVLYLCTGPEHDLGSSGPPEPDIALLRKPFTQEALARAVRQLLGRDGA